MLKKFLIPLLIFCTTIIFNAKVSAAEFEIQTSMARKYGAARS